VTKADAFSLHSASPAHDGTTVEPRPRIFQGEAIMRATTLIATLALTGGILGAGAALVPAFAQSPGMNTASQTDGLTMQQVQTRLEAAGYRDFEKIERERNKFEVKATDQQGQRVELDIDPMTGEILKTEVKRSK